ncbi:prospero homeobox protein 1-like [Brachyistius frenatus]|uniref:prospero homeobox protein 1-like n=1 Tax=Brachyistius frenatus TaxID=100188 RepID=UPI0037E7D5EF
MNQSVWSHGVSSSSSAYLNVCTPEHLSSFEPDPTPTDSDASGVPVTLNPSPASCGHHHDWNLTSGHRAKRARVENIIKGMSGPPGMCWAGVTADPREEAGRARAGEAIQELPLNPKHTERRSGCGGTSRSRATGKQLEGRHRHLGPVGARLTHVDGVSEDSSKEEKDPSWDSSPETSQSETCTDSHSEFEGSSSRKYQGWKKVKLMNYFQSKPERIKLMADVLKYELSRAVSRSVDSIFKSVPLLQTSANDSGHAETETPLQPSVCGDNRLRLSCCGTAEVRASDVQTEALSLVVQKPELERSNQFVLQSGSTAQHPKSSIPFSHDSAPRGDRGSEKNRGAGHQRALACLQDGRSEAGRSKIETFDTHWSSVKVRSKVNSRCVRSPQIHAVSVDPMLLESLCLPHVKIESDSLVKNNLYMLNEGLTTNHLKKAKLMFFYSRYPSSLVLKTCFHDVQFTRCITSQLIKWFSNFREFYYIQMEKFARHALMEGVADARGLTVGRESELFRALNVHYNKANDFQVPERFLEVAEITLREFYIAISVGKDRDPSWKKAIYKVICKLDSDLPAEFKSYH